MIKVTVKLDKRYRLKNGKYPLKIKVARNGGAFYISTGFELEEREWDVANSKIRKRQSQRIDNLRLSKKLTYVNDKIEELREGGKLRSFSNRRLSQFLSGEGEPDNDYLLKTQFQELLSTKDKQGTKNIYLYTESKISAFCDYDSLLLSDIDIDWINSFVSFLKKNGNSKNTIAIRLMNIRAVLNFARKKGLLKDYVFDMYTIRMEETKKRALTVEELRTLHNAKLSRLRTKYRDIFFLVFFLMGINIIDLFGLSSIENGRVIYRRSKTGTLYDIKVEPEALEIINRYKGEKHLLNVFDGEKDCKNFEININKMLRNISSELGLPKITTYWARHSFATIAYQIGISIDIIADCLGHKGGHKITNVYIKKDQNKIDEANRKVIDYVLYNKK